MAARQEERSVAAWLHADMADAGTARTYYRMAIDAARRAEHGLLTAYMTGSLAQFELDEDPLLGLRLLARARTVMGDRPPPTTRAWLACLEALAHATARDERSCHTALAEAHRAVKASEQAAAPPWPWVFPFTGAKLAGFRALCAVRLARPAQALEAFAESLNAIQPAEKQRATLLLEIASIRRMEGEFAPVVCGCGKVHAAARPQGVPSAPVSLGINLQAWCVYLMIAHAIPVHRCVELVVSLTGAQPSPGFVHGMIARAATAVVQANLRIRALLTAAYVVCCDETPIRVGAKKAKKYLLVACTSLYTWYMLGDRTMATFKKFIIADLSGVLVHDRYQNYDSAELGVHVHQLCTSHLLRDLEDCAETYPGAAWPAQIQTALRGLIHAANLAREQGHPAMSAGTQAMWINSFRHGVRVGLSQVRRIPGPAKTVTQPIGRVLLEVLRDRENDVLRFAHDLQIPPTSNQAERDIRPAKTQQKISGRLRSEQTTEHRYAIRGYISTAAKHGADVMTAIRDALLGRAWMPPDPLPA
ncbi:IS66 family transposase [Nonomuraea basaltis]|uniref:IS66 family transposase n=1 Tax=Nonomuraea basaltis TaxID=2495887 RepID=UPI00110C5478|nr:IS66 family transposase [Nonomuraea basaltis]TMR88382.1 IS66 family transposase [Nonomuraea basaltis]